MSAAAAAAAGVGLGALFLSAVLLAYYAVTDIGYRRRRRESADGFDAFAAALVADDEEFWDRLGERVA